MKVRGFTLMEMIITIVVGSFIMLGIAGYLQLGAKGYADSIDRQHLQTQAQFVIEKMSREIRHAVPNSFAVTQDGRCLSFFPIAMAGFYNRQGSNRIDFIVGNLKADGSHYDTIPVGLRMIINPSHFYDFSNSTEQMDVGATEKSGSVFTTSQGNAFNRDSVGERLYLFHPDAGVRYCWNMDNQLLERGNITTEKHGKNDMFNVRTISDNVSSLVFDYQPRALHSGGMVYMNLVLEQNGERSVYQQGVQVLNVP